MKRIVLFMMMALALTVTTTSCESETIEKTTDVTEEGVNEWYEGTYIIYEEMNLTAIATVYIVDGHFSTSGTFEGQDILPNEWDFEIVSETGNENLNNRRINIQTRNSDGSVHMRTNGTPSGFFIEEKVNKEIASASQTEAKMFIGHMGGAWLTNNNNGLMLNIAVKD